MISLPLSSVSILVLVVLEISWIRITFLLTGVFTDRHVDLIPYYLCFILDIYTTYWQYIIFLASYSSQ